MILRKLLVVVYLCTLVQAQQTPDVDYRGPAIEPVHVLPAAPSVSGGRHERWTLFAIAAAADLGASAYDSYITDVGLHSGHGCTEANTYLGPHPSTGALYGKNIGISLGLIGLGYAFKRMHLLVAPYAAMGIDAGKHLHGTWQWYHFKGGACL